MVDFDRFTFKWRTESVGFLNQTKLHIKCVSSDGIYQYFSLPLAWKQKSERNCYIGKVYFSLFKEVLRE